MHLPHFRGKKVVIFVGVLLLAAAGTVLAGGQQEDPIAIARDLIIRNRLNDAILLLTEAVRKNPQLIDEAEGLMQKIRSIRSEYYALWEQLIYTIKNEPDKPDKAIAIIEKMKKLDAAPNEQTRQNINEWQNIVQFRFNLDRFNKIMVASDQLLNSSKYPEAIDSYMSGFDIFRPEFESAGYSQDLVVAKVDAAEKQLTEMIQKFLVQMPQTSSAADSFAATVKTAAPNELERNLAQFRGQLSRALSTRDQLQTIADNLDRVNEQIHLENAKVPQDWHVTFLTWYIRGRPEVKSSEGLIAAIAGFVDSAQRGPDAAMVSRATDDFKKAITVYADGPPGDARSAFATALATSNLGLQIQRLWEERLNPGPQLNFSTDEQSAIKTHLPEYLLYEKQAQASQSYLDLIGIRQRTETVDAASGDTIPSLGPKREIIEQALKSLDQVAGKWRQTKALLEGPQAPYASQDSRDVVDRILADSQREISDLQTRDVRIVSRIASLELAGFQQEFSPLPAQLDEAARNLDGIEQTVTTQGTTTTVTTRFPGKALAILEQTQKTLGSLDKSVGGYLSDLQSSPPFVQQAPSVQTSLSAASQLTASIKQLLGTLTDRFATAQKDVQLATSLRARADRSIQEATAALSRNDAQTAINKIQEARDLSIQALQIQQDEAYSQSVDKQLAALSEQIKQVNYVRVVNLVRDLINKGRGEYQQDQFAQAERDLLQARRLWSQVSPSEPQQEVENWLRVVQSALNLQNTRELTEIDPLFFTLGNYLNRAKENFAEGKQLYASGNPQEGQKFLTKAEENIQSVVVARPFNQEARVLSLRILQITSPKQFPEIFKQRFDEAVGRSKTQPQAALVDLYDLRAIDPTFRGLQDAIVALEIQLGIRPNPVTIAKKQQADALVAEAQRLAAAGTRTQTEVAVARLQTALELNPDNTNAQVLLDRYRIALGSPATYTLPSTTMQEFSQAQNLFIAGRLADALAIVDRIWQNPSNRGYAPLVDLRKNILARLGQ